MRIVVGLGNPGDEYEGTRHNTGRAALGHFRKKHGFPEWRFDKKLDAQLSEGKIGTGNVLLATPDTFMNDSGKAVGQLIRSGKSVADLLVVYDDLDLPLGTFKVSFGRSSGGHNGLESVIRTVKTKDFPRLRIGISPVTPSGKTRKPTGEEAVLRFLLGRFSERERTALLKVFKRTSEAVETAVTDGYEAAMNRFN